MSAVRVTTGSTSSILDKPSSVAIHIQLSKQKIMSAFNSTSTATTKRAILFSGSCFVGRERTQWKRGWLLLVASMPFFLEPLQVFSSFQGFFQRVEILLFSNKAN